MGLARLWRPPDIDHLGRLVMPVPGQLYRGSQRGGRTRSLAGRRADAPAEGGMSGGRPVLDPGRGSLRAIGLARDPGTSRKSVLAGLARCASADRWKLQECDRRRKEIRPSETGSPIDNGTKYHESRKSHDHEPDSICYGREHHGTSALQIVAAGRSPSSSARESCSIWRTARVGTAVRRDPLFAAKAVAVPVEPLAMQDGAPVIISICLFSCLAIVLPAVFITAPCIPYMQYVKTTNATS